MINRELRFKLIFENPLRISSYQVSFRDDNPNRREISLR
jgi:hypothetical protein